MANLYKLQEGNLFGCIFNSLTSHGPSMCSQIPRLGIVWTFHCCELRFFSLKREQKQVITSLGLILPIGSMYGIYANIWGILMVNVTIYSIHGSYGLWMEHRPLRYVWFDNFNGNILRQPW